MIKFMLKFFFATLFFLSVISFSDTVYAASKTQLDVYVIATQQDMDQGQFKIEFRETVIAGEIREYEIPVPPVILTNKSDSFIKPYIDSPSGNFQFDYSGKVPSLNFSFQNSGQAIYGYTVKPTPGISGSGFCNSDIGIFGVYGTFPFGSFLQSMFSDVKITFEIPDGMPVYAPWNKISDRIYKIVEGGIGKNYFVAAWGNFSSVEIRQYGGNNEHTFYMLGYGTDTKKNFELTGFTYDYFMKAFQNNITFLPSVNLVIVLPGGNYDYMPAGEGPGGSYFPNELGDTLDAKIDVNGGHAGCKNGIKYFNYIINGNELTVAPVHMSAHASLVFFLPDWWGNEGIAVFYQFDMLYRKGIITEAIMKKEFASHLKYYQDNILGTNNDHALKNFSAMISDVGEIGYCTNFWIAYIKGSLVFYALNNLIKESTNGKSELIDLFTIVYGMFKNGYSYEYSTFISALNSLMGIDFKDFFEKYIYGTEPLPLEILGDEIILTYNKTSLPPVLKITADTQDQLSVSSGESFSLEINSKIFPDMKGQNADWWVAADTPFGWYSHSDNKGWQAGISPFKQESLSTFSSIVLKDVILPMGKYNFYFAIDDNMDGIPDATWLDSVSVQVVDFNKNFDFPFSIPNTTITIDGKADDWAGIVPILTDYIGDSTCGSGTDIKDAYLAMDGKYLYWRLDTSSGTYKFNDSNGVGPSLRFYNKKSDGSLSDDILFQMIGGGDNYSITTKDSSGNWNSYNPGSGYGKISDIAEGKIPLSLFGNNLYNYFWIGFYGNADVNNPTCDQVSQ